LRIPWSYNHGSKCFQKGIPG